MPLTRWISCLLLLLVLCPWSVAAQVLGGGGSGGGTTIRVQDEGTNAGPAARAILNCTGSGIVCTDNPGAGRVDITVSGVGESGLADPGGNGLVNRTSVGVTAPYAGASCTNQVLRVLSPAGAGTCVTITSAYVNSSICTAGQSCTGYQASLGFTPEDTANKSTSTALGSSDTLFPTQKAVKDYVDAGLALKQGTVTWGAGLTVSAATASVLSTEAGFLTDGGSTDLTGGSGQQGKMQVMDDGTLQYTDGGPTGVLRKGHLTQSGLVWDIDVNTCLNDPNGGKLTILSNTITCAADEGGGGGGGPTLTGGDGIVIADDSVRTASEEAHFLTDAGTTEPTCGTGTQGIFVVMDDGSYAGCSGATDAVLSRGVLTQTGYTWGLTTADCDPTTDECKVTVDVDGTTLVLKPDSGEGVSAGDITGVGAITSGAVGTAAAPLTGLILGTEAAPGTPAAAAAALYVDSGDKNLKLKNEDGTVKVLVEPHAAVSSEWIRAIGADGAVTGSQPASTDLSDVAALVTLTGAQKVADKQVVPRVVQLGAASGSVTPNADTTDLAFRYNVSGTLDFQAPSATGDNPTHGQLLRILLGSGTAQALTWAAAYGTGFGLPLPTSTTGGTDVYDAYAFLYSTNDSKWHLISATKSTMTRPPKQVLIESNPASVTVNVDAIDEVAITALAQAVDIEIPTGTPTNAQYLAFNIYSASTQTLTWDTGANGYSNESGIELPTTSRAGTRLMLVFRWNSATSKWALIGASAPTAVCTVADGCTGLTSGTSGGVLAFTASGTIASSGVLTANLPVIGGGAGVAPTVGTRSGTTTQFATVTGTKTTNKQLAFDGDGNVIASGTDIGSGGGGGTGTLQLPVAAIKLPSSNPATPDVGETNTRLLFDASTSECAIWEFVLPDDYASTPVLKLKFSMTSATSGTLNFDVSVMAVTTGDSADINTESYDTANACDDAAVPATAGHLDQIACSLTSVDSMAANDLVKLRVCRDVGDTATGDAELVRASLLYTK